MSYQENILGFTAPGHDGVTVAPDRSGTCDFRPAITRRPEPHMRARLPKLGPQDLVSLLFRQRARARMAALPRVSVSVSVFAPSGRPAVQISL